MKQLLFSEQLCHQFRQSKKDFTRTRLLSFPCLLVLLVSGHKLSLQNALNKVFKTLGKVFQTPTGSAYCQARQKIQAAVFVRLNESVRDDFYSLYGADNEVRKWRGHRLLGSDGTYLNLPDTPELRAAFSVHTNQHSAEKAGAVGHVQALGMVLYDLLNDIGVRGALGPSHSAEKSLLFNELWGELKAGEDVLVLDRNSADYTIIGQAARDGIGVVIRCPRQSFKAVMNFFESDERERLVMLTIPQSRSTREYVREHGLPEQAPVRLLKFRLPNGAEEVLLTTLCDRKKYPRQEFFRVYGWRWSDETYYDRVKNIFEVERFSGEKEENIRQDFYGVLFLATLESVLSREPESVMQELAMERDNQTMPQINHAVSYVALVGTVATLLLDERVSVQETLRELKYQLSRNPTRVRKGRRYERKKLSHAQRLRHHLYKKRVTA